MAERPGLAAAYGVKRRGKTMSSGGEACRDDDDDMVGAVMKKRKMAMGGDVRPDEESADYDVTDQMPEDHEADDTGANSGDDLGDPDTGPEKESDDVVERAMRRRRDRNPRPA